MSSTPANQILDVCESTNDLARALGEQGCHHGTWISAREQTKGRGRIGREWTSQSGNLFLSIVVRPQRRDLWTWIPLSAAVGTTRALTGAFPALDLRIKWPNDLWLSNRKVAGILCEGVGTASGAYIIIGLGLNCATHPEIPDRPATSLAAALGDNAPANLVDLVRPQILESILASVSTLDAQGPALISDFYASRAAFPSGTEIAWTAPDGEHSGNVVGLGSAGELLVRKSSGEVRLFAEEVRISRHTLLTQPLKVVRGASD